MYLYARLCKPGHLFVFTAYPDGGKQKKEESELNSRIKEVLQEARKDLINAVEL